VDFIPILLSFQLSTIQWVAIGLSGFLLGASKSGISGIGLVIIVILAFVFGEKASTGVLLPMLIVSDILAVIYYNKHVQWNYVMKLMPLMLVGVLVGVWLGNDISELVFKRIMAIIIILSVVVMNYTEKRRTSIPNNKLFAHSTGFLAGVASMIGNLAGPIADVYFLAIRLPKNEFIGTGAWLFFIINVFKLPFHILVWDTVNVESMVLNLALVPLLVLGFFVGAYIVKLISNVNYRRFIFIVTAVGAIVLLFR
jgi:uncharacterized membrane protein YfcA